MKLKDWGKRRKGIGDLLILDVAAPVGSRGAATAPICPTAKSKKIRKVGSTLQIFACNLFFPHYFRRLPESLESKSE
jgi:hypothetical protein